MITKHHLRTTVVPVLSVLLAFALLIMTPSRASASWGSLTMHYESDGTITGTCHVVVNAAYESNGATGDRATQFWVTLPDGQTIIGYCGNSYFSEPGHGDHAQPGEDDYSFTAVSNGDGSYNVTIHSENSRYVNNYSNYKATIEDCPGLFSRDRQRVYIPWWIPKTGDVELLKVSANPELTDGNDNYSFEGAVYTVRNNDATLSSLDAYLYVDASGIGTLRRWTDGTSPNASDERIRIPAGSYVVWEHEAPKGYKLDSTHYEVTVNDGETATITVEEKPEGATLDLLKVSSNHSMTDDNPCYSLAGATYGVYMDEACSNEVGTLVTNEDGCTNSLTLAAGTYYVKETKPSKGYALDSRIYTVTLENGKSARVDAQELPQCDPVELIVMKTDADLKLARPQGEASLANAQFCINFYAGYYDDAESLPDNPTRSWTLKTDEQGTAKLAEKYKLEGDEFYLDSSGTVAIPLGTIAITEVQAPLGYRSVEGVCDLQQITSEGTLEQLQCFVEPKEGKPTVFEAVYRGGVTLKKEGADGEGLAGAVFEISNASSNPVVVNGTSFAPKEACLTLTSDERGVASCLASTLPYGAYQVKELTAPQGYQLNKEWSQTFVINQDGQMVDLTSKPCPNAPLSVTVTLNVTKSFDGSSMNRELEEGQFTFLLMDESGNTLQKKTNDKQGNVAFDELTFGYEDIGEHRYAVTEDQGTDDEIVYDDHTEHISITVVQNEDGSLEASVATDDDGLVFHNKTVDTLAFPNTGMKGAKGIAANATVAMLAGTTMSSRLLRRRRR